MNKYGRLLSQISQEYSINRGNSESEVEWKTRILYSYVSVSAYASLWDIQEDSGNVSINHFKKKIEDLLHRLCLMYPEVSFVFQGVESAIADEIYSIFLEAGVIYHSPHRICSAMPSSAHIGKCTFIRGEAVSQTKKISGIGGYLITEENRAGTSPDLAAKMFQLQEGSLNDYWHQMVDGLTFRKQEASIDFQFLQETRFQYGYWTNNPDRTGDISIARIGLEGRQIYYFYKFRNDEMYTVQIPSWRCENYGYRSLTNACLYVKNKLPKTEFKVDGELVHIRLGYLFPPSEMALLKLYSWPDKYSSFPSDFYRCLNQDVFLEIKSLLERTGYMFEEEQ